MKAGEILINGIFNGSRLLEVPFYQRKYVWDYEQWDRFLDDMEFISRTKRPYFFGSIILKKGTDMGVSDEYSDKRIVIDGQQRLTTLIIFMKILCLLNDANGLFEKDFVLEQGTVALQHGKNDVDAFEKVVNAKSIDDVYDINGDSRIIECAKYFADSIDPDKVNRNCIKTYAQFVCIDLLDDEDEQQVFDTINSLGVRLTTAELLKNFFFHRDNVEEYKEKWESVFEKDEETKNYWEQEIEMGRMKRSMIDIFFDSYFQLFIQDKKYDVKTEDKIAYARVGQLSQSYQQFIKEYCHGDKTVITNPLRKYADSFKSMFDPDVCYEQMSSEYGLDRINVIIFGLRNTTIMPYILYLRNNIQDEDQFVEMLRIIEAFIMRRIIVHANTKNYNNLFTSLILNKVDHPDALLEKLYDNVDATTYVPNDDEVQNGFDTSKLINLQSKGILYFIEASLHSKKAAVSLLGFNQYSLEHLMPKKWDNNWTPCENEEDKWERNRILLTLGNLAIIPQSLNASIRDSNWATKKSGKDGHPGLKECASGLITLQGPLDIDNWSEDEIFNRSKWLCDKALEIWKL